MISILVPTRGRVAMFKEMVRSVERTTQYNDIEIIAYLDEDDPALSVYLEMFQGDGNDKRVVGPRIILTDCWNKCFEICTGSIVMQGNDDIVFRTRGWDREIGKFFSASQDKIWMVHGNDLNPNRNPDEFGTHCFVHRRWIQTLGYFIPPFFSSDYGDTWLNDLANRIKRRAYLPFVCEHMHYSLGKSEYDGTAQERIVRHKQDNVEAIWESKVLERERDAAKLQAVIDQEATR